MFPDHITRKRNVANTFLPVGSRWLRLDITLQWRHNGRDGVLNHLPRHCLLNPLFRCRSRKTSNIRVICLCVGNSLVTGHHKCEDNTHCIEDEVCKCTFFAQVYGIQHCSEEKRIICENNLYVLIWIWTSSVVHVSIRPCDAFINIYNLVCTPKFTRVKDDPMKLTKSINLMFGQRNVVISDSPLKVGYGTCFVSPIYRWLIGLWLKLYRNKSCIYEQSVAISVAHFTNDFPIVFQIR